MKEYYAHIYNNQKEPLIHHLTRTAEFAEEFGKKIGYGKVMRQIALLHDVGKRTTAFQNVLAGKEMLIDHAIVGANIYKDMGAQYCDNPQLRMIIANVIASHHTDLSGEFRLRMRRKWECEMDVNESRQRKLPKDKRHALKYDVDLKEYEEIKQYCLDNNLFVHLTPDDYPDMSEMNPADIMTLTRHLGSCLYDADYTATAELANPNYIAESTGKELDVDEMLIKLEQYRNNLIQNAKPSVMNSLRNQVYQDAADAGQTCAPGLYTMTAPTGTGKTLALIKFALESAKKNHQDRVFVILPYISIIHQNVGIYKEIFGDDIVIEDDSSIYVSDTDEGATLQNKLYTERWTAPIIVTTSQRFFTVLKSAHASTLRPFHNIANCAVVFDEAQTLPYDLLDVTMQFLEALSKYNATVLLSTATQPDYAVRQYMGVSTTEIIKDKAKLFADYRLFKNTRVSFLRGKFNYNSLAKHYQDNTKTDCPQACFIFNTTKKTKKMKKALIKIGACKEDIFLLSTNLSPQHKMDTITEITRRIEHHIPFYLCTTQCIEAGVDLDIPVVYREYGPLTSVIQAAGRCDRNGRYVGYFYVFELEDTFRKYGSPDEIYQYESRVTNRISVGRENLYDAELSRIYYKKLFEGDGVESRDKQEIIEAFERLAMDDLDEAYQLIEKKQQVHVLVPYEGTIDQFNAMQSKLEQNGYHTTYKELKRCTPFTVTKYMSGKLDDLTNWCHSIYIRGNEETMWYIADEEPDRCYDQRDGLVIDDPDDEDDDEAIMV